VGFNPLTGDTNKLASSTLKFDAATDTVFPFLDSHSRNILLMASASGKVAVYPPSSEAQALAAQHAAEVFYFVVDTEAQSMRGFSLHAAAAGSGKEEVLRGVQTCSLHFPRAHEVVQSAVRVLGRGDGGFLCKYLNSPKLRAVGRDQEQTDLRVAWRCACVQTSVQTQSRRGPLDAAAAGWRALLSRRSEQSAQRRWLRLRLCLGFLERRGADAMSA
jgi:hypothetical protein